MLEPITIAHAATLIESGELTPSELLEQCLHRMDLYESEVRAWVYVDRERARDEAAMLTDELRAGRCRGPLHGIPFGIKDIFDVFDMPTGCGSRRWAGSFAHTDAVIVHVLRKAGALILGKTVTTPYAYLDPPPTRNPWDRSRTPGGSSSGSAAAVACGMCLAAVATQTGGSTIRPASYCGVAGYKPTWGRFRLDGCLPLAPSLDHVGFIAHTVRDLAIIFEALTQGEQRESALPSRRLARMPGFQPEELESHWAARWSQFLELLIATGWDFVHAEVPESLRAYATHQSAIYAREAWLVHGQRLRRHPDDYPARITELVNQGGRVAAVELQAAIEHFTHTRQSIHQAIPPGTIGVLTPASSGPAPDCSTTGSPAWQAPWTYSGTPMISWPLPGEGLPVAAQFIGRPLEDYALLAAAAQLESITPRTPRLPPEPE